MKWDRLVQHSDFYWAIETRATSLWCMSRPSSAVIISSRLSTTPRPMRNPQSQWEVSNVVWSVPIIQSSPFAACTAQFVNKIPSSPMDTRVSLFYPIPALFVDISRNFLLDIVDNCIGIKNRRYYLMFWSTTSFLLMASIYPLSLLEHSGSTSVALRILTST